jgi:hypothetical protein
VVEEHDPIGEAVGLLEVLGREHERHSLLHQAADELPDVVAALRVEPGGRFVQEQHRRARDEAGGEIEAAAHAAGERAHEPVAGLFEPELGDQLACALANQGARHVVQPPDELEVGACGEQAVDGRALAGEADAGADVGG